jgi:hypothetical protein
MEAMRMPNSSIKNEDVYEELHEQGMPELEKRARELGLSGYSGLTKGKLIAELRDH